MKSLIFPVTALLAIILATGCTSPQAKRSAEFPAVLAALPAELQDQVLNGYVAEGYSTDMVYIALGKPSAVEAGEEGGQHIEVWTYRNYVPGSYTPPRTRRAMSHSHALTEWGDSSLPSGPSSKDDQIATPRSGSGTGGAVTEASAWTLKLLIANGRVIAIHSER